MRLLHIDDEPDNDRCPDAAQIKGGWSAALTREKWKIYSSTRLIEKILSSRAGRPPAGAELAMTGVACDDSGRKLA